MDSSSIELPGPEVAQIRVTGDEVAICFSRVIIIKTMSGSKERTRWWQAGELVFGGAELQEQPPAGELVCGGGDVGENIYPYRDMIPVPLQSRGSAHCDLRFDGTEAHLRLHAESVELRMADRPRYIEHLKP